MQTKTTRKTLVWASFGCYLAAGIILPLIKQKRYLWTYLWLENIPEELSYVSFAVYFLISTIIVTFVSIFVQRKPVWFMMLSVGSTVLTVCPMYIISKDMVVFSAYYYVLVLLLIGSLSSFFNGMILPRYMTKNLCIEC